MRANRGWWLLPVFVVLGACGGSGSPSDTAARTLTGAFELENGEATDRSGGDCKGTGGYSDMKSGVEVIVKDAAGVIIGQTRLAADSAFLYGNGCRYTFEVPALPVSGFYTVTVGKRGDQTYSEADLEAMGWAVSLHLGK